MSASTVPSQAARALPLLMATALVLGFLYLARAVVIPVALAVLFTFLLAPVVNALQRAGLGRVPSVVAICVLTLGLLAGLGYMVTQQIGGLLDSYPRYEQNVSAKIAGLRAAGREGLLDKLQAVTERIQQQIEAGAAPAPAPAVAGPDGAPPQPVRIVQDGPFKLSQLWSSAGPLLEPLANIGLVLVLVIFMLINREDLRDRIISLIGTSQLADTTRALADAGSRVSRYLLLQLMINVGFGVVVAAGLWLIGVPHAPLWGFFAALLRYIPYIGSWLAAMLPLAMSLLIAREWGVALAVLALFGVAELVTNMLIEPWLYGRGMGVSQAALLVAVAFWTWLWGPVGLLLASPLTVCLVVLGRHVPYLRFLDTLLGDRPALQPWQRFYQRLLARDEDEAATLLEQVVAKDDLEHAFDAVVVPTLAGARVDERNGKLDAERHRQLIGSVGVLIDDQRRTEPSGEPPAGEPLAVLAIPARDASDELAVAMLGRLVDPARVAWRQASSAALASDVLEQIEREQPDALVLCSIPPGGLAHARYLCKRIRARFPRLRIVIGRFGLFEEAHADNRSQLAQAGADRMAASLAEAASELRKLATLD